MKEALKQDTEMGNSGSLSRRKFLNYAGAIAGAGVLIASCKKDKTTPVVGENSVDLGTFDPGLLNYAFALQQLKTAYFSYVLEHTYPGATDAEIQIFRDIRDHSLVHREVLKNYQADYAIEILETNFSMVDFGLRTSVMTTAQLICESVIAGMNGICQILMAGELVTLLARMVSVDARHSVVINNYISYGNFGDKLDANGMDTTLNPQTSITVVNQFFKKQLDGNRLPKY